MWTPGNQPIAKYDCFKSIVKEYSRDLNDNEARILLYHILKSNPAFTISLLTGNKLKILPIQEFLLKGMWLRDYSLIIASRGFGKSFLICLNALLYSVFNPNSQQVIISSNFRTSRKILEQLESWINQPECELLRQCFPYALSKKNDVFTYKGENSSSLFALPLSNGDGLRGIRSQMCQIDEIANVSKEIQESIIRPFLVVRADLQTRLEFQEIENDLISKGLITEKDRISNQKNKYLMFGSATYEFQYPYEVYQNYLTSILAPKKEGAEDNDTPTYFIARLGFDAFPENSSILDQSVIKAAQTLGGESQQFKMEYRALFSKSSDGYFNAAKLAECTLKLGEYPTTQLKGDPNFSYIVTVDPSQSSAKTSDYFAIGVFMLIPETRKIIQVHTFAHTGTGKDLSYVYEYFSYILKSFNVVFTCIDDTGSLFVPGYNESVISKKHGIKLEYVAGEPHKSAEYKEEIKKMKADYNRTARRFLMGFHFSASTSLLVNEHLQNEINAKKVWFASPCSLNESEYHAALNTTLSFDLKDNDENAMSMSDFIEEQDSLITATKNQTAMVEVKANPMGTLQFDLPNSAKREKGANRAKKDLYTTLLLGCWAAHCYYDMIFTPDDNSSNSFTPIFIK